ncbi:MAG: cell division protein FtsA [SAR324 cluster bacterium]|jgi:cell division protein FtsA|nr:cell division protein FtsA [SAR324 cluster bacterium]MDP6521595.1 cell division protein FtsA [SAR324 cluster bacterium]|tara:strand:+ start:1017 stop:2258 length:1242 start_codon:yes stop_codon:yes gene_type:complete
MPSQTKSNNLIVGLDIGTTKICAIAVEGDDIEALNVVGVGTAKSEGLRKGVVVNIEKTVKAIKKAVEECELMCGTQIRSVYAGIAGHHIRGQNSRGMVTVYHNRIVTDEDIRRVIDAAQVLIPNDREVLHILPQEFIVDDQDGVQNPLGMAAARLEVNVHIVTGSVTSAQNIIKCCNQSGLDVEDIVLEPLSSSQAVLSPDEQEVGVVLVDIGGGTTDVTIYSEGSIVHTAVLALGGNHLTHDIAIGLGAPLHEAEEIKHNFGVAMTSMVKENDMIEVPSVGGRNNRTMKKRVLASIIEDRFREIFELIAHEIEKTHFHTLMASGVVITGGTCIMPGADQLASQVLNLPVRVGFPENISGLREMIYSPKYATSVGLVRYGITSNQGKLHFAGDDTNLFHKVSRRMKDWMQNFF